MRAHRSVREGYACGQCRSSMRYRAQAEAILHIYGSNADQTFAELVETDRWHRMAIYEPGVTGPFRKYLKGKSNYTLSFYWEDVSGGQERDGVPCQDLTRTTFEDESFDLVITSDIFEHIRKPLEGFEEVRRILKKGGYHVCSVPAVDPLPAKSVTRVDTSTDEDIHLLPEVYHGSGVAGGRSLVYTDFGADIAEMLQPLAIQTELRRYQPCPALPPLVTFLCKRVD